jgi:hypothetical protein
LQSDASRESAQFLREQLRIRSWTRADFARALSTAAGRRIGANVANRWFDEVAPVQPTWAQVAIIARALELPFEEVRSALGYRAPDEPPRPTLEPWVVDGQRRARLLQNTLERVPVEARRIERLNASQR